jgi:hypothetical protein
VITHRHVERPTLRRGCVRERIVERREILKQDMKVSLAPATSSSDVGDLFHDDEPGLALDQARCADGEISGGTGEDVRFDVGPWTELRDHAVSAQDVRRPIPAQRLRRRSEQLRDTWRKGVVVRPSTASSSPVLI